MSEPLGQEPAFPSTYWDTQPDSGKTVPREVYFGITMRDWFAGQALSGIIASYSERENIASAPTAAKTAYEHADAMLSQRRTQIPRSNLATAREAIGHIKSILEAKDREGVDIEIGSTALKSLIRWAQECDDALNA